MRSYGRKCSILAFQPYPVMFQNILYGELPDGCTVLVLDHFQSFCCTVLQPTFDFHGSLHRLDNVCADWKIHFVLKQYRLRSYGRKYGILALQPYPDMSQNTLYGNEMYVYTVLVLDYFQ